MYKWGRPVSSDKDIEDVKDYLRGKANHLIMSVKDKNDPDYKTMKAFVQEIKPTTDDYMYSVSSTMNTLLSSLRHMEPNDYNKIVNTFKKYHVDGSSGGITGKRTYGYDRSRVDGAMIRRKRGN